MPFGKKSGPNCPLDGFRQLEKLFIHAFHLFSGLIHPGGAWDRVAFRGAARQGIRGGSCEKICGDALKIELLDAGDHFGGVALVVEFVESHYKCGGFAVAADKVVHLLHPLIHQRMKRGVIL